MGITHISRSTFARRAGSVRENVLLPRTRMVRCQNGESRPSFNLQAFRETEGANWEGVMTATGRLGYKLSSP